MKPTIYKYPITAGDVQRISIPGYLQTLCVQLQEGVPYIWVLCYPNGPITVRTFRLYGTGFPGVMGIYVGTFQLEPFVWHLFEDRI